jgi:glycosyltransferase involved in cell wall biosynthesis
MTKINLSPGLRFNAPITALALSQTNLDFNIYTSSPRRKWPVKSQDRILFRPLPFKIIEYFLRFKRNRYIREIDAIFYDKIVSTFSRDCDIFHGWATFALETAKKHKNKDVPFILDRACPHIEFQQNLLQEEAELTKSIYNPVSNKFLERCLEEYELADQILVPSLYSSNSFLEKGFKKDKIKILKLNANFTPKKRKIFSQQADSFVLGTVGGNPLRKGIKYLVDAWQELKLPRSQLLIKTDEFELEKNKELFQRIKKDKTIIIVSYVNNIEDFYIRCDLFCLPSIDDGFGLVVLEAMGCGIPVIATKNVGASEMIKNNYNGFVGEKRDVSFLAEKILECYKDRKFLKDLSNNSFLFYQKHIKSKENYTNKIIKLYKDII